MGWSYGAPLSQQQTVKVASYAYADIPTPPLEGVDVLIVENPPADHNIDIAEFLGCQGTAVSAGHCLVIGRLPLELSVTNIPSPYGTFCEVMFSGASEPTRKNPGVLLLVAEHKATTDFKGFLETVTKLSRPTNACPTYTTIAFTREQPPVVFATLEQAGGRGFFVFHTCGPYHMTPCAEVKYDEFQGGVSMMWPLSLAGNGQVVDPAIGCEVASECAEQAPEPPDWEGDEASADGSDGDDSEMSERPATEQPRGSDEDDSEMSERPATEQPVEEYALACDLRPYTLAEFINHYGEMTAHKIWQPSLHATTDARAAIKNLREVDGPALANFWALISGWVPTAQTVEAANDLMMSAFYMPLRWRYEFLQSEDVPPELWGSYDLSAQQMSMWKYVKNSVTTFALTSEQRAEGKRNTLTHVINKLCKNTNLCKLLLNYGAVDAPSLRTILGALAALRARSQPGAQQQPQQENEAVTVAAEHTSEVLRAQTRLRLRSRSRTRSRSLTRLRSRHN